MQGIPFGMPPSFRQIELRALEHSRITGVGHRSLGVKRGETGELSEKLFSTFMNLLAEFRIGEIREKQKGAGSREFLPHKQQGCLRSEEQESCQCTDDSGTGFHMQPVSPQLIRNLIVILEIKDEPFAWFVLDDSPPGFLLSLVSLSLKEEGSFHG